MKVRKYISASRRAYIATREETNTEASLLHMPIALPLAKLSASNAA